LGALEKSRKKKTMALRVRPKRRRQLWELWKNHEKIETTTSSFQLGRRRP